MNKIEKPWGWELIIEENPEYTLKKLFMKKKCQCSLQYHEYKKETIYILDGNLTIQIDKTSNIFYPDTSITIPPGVAHRMSAIDKYVLYLEASTTYPEDVIRIEDDYNRV